MKKKTCYEMLCYGIMSGFAALLFVFGAIYPDYVYTQDSYRMITTEGFSEEELQKPVYELDRSRIKISGKIYESILRLLEEREDDKRCISVRMWDSIPERRNGQNRNHNSGELL